MINVLLALMIIVSFLLAVAIHSTAQALAARLLGDPTPSLQDRRGPSLRAHLDPLGTLVCIIQAFYGPMGIGWGKPIKTDPWKLRGGPNVGTLLVALAGIVSSICVGLLVALLVRFLPVSLGENAYTIRIVQFLLVFSVGNVLLGLFHILPIYPLDGYQVLYTLLPSRHALKFARSAQYGPLIIIGLVFILPFIGQITRTSGFFLFHLPYLFLQVVFLIVSPITGAPYEYVMLLYQI